MKNQGKVPYDQQSLLVLISILPKKVYKKMSLKTTL